MVSMAETPGWGIGIIYIEFVITKSWANFFFLKKEEELPELVLEAFEWERNLPPVAAVVGGDDGVARGEAVALVKNEFVELMELVRVCWWWLVVRGDDARGIDNNGVPVKEVNELDLLIGFGVGLDSVSSIAGGDTESGLYENKCS